MKKVIYNISLLIMVMILSSCTTKCDDLKSSGENKCDMTLEEALRLPNWSNRSEAPPSWKIPKINGAPASTVPDDSGPITWIVRSIEEAMRNGSEIIYNGLVNDVAGGGQLGFRNIIAMCVVLSIMFYGASIILAIKKANAYEMISFVVKIIIAFQLGTNWDIFESFVINNIEGEIQADGTLSGGLVPELSGIMSSAFAGADGGIDNIYFQIDKTLFMFLTGNYWKVLMATATTGWSGFFYAMILLLIVIYYMIGVLDALKVYLISVIARFLLYAIAPLYFTFLLFDKTKSMFDAWLEQVVNFSLQPILLFAFFGMFQMLIINFMQTQMVLGDSSQYKLVLAPLINLGFLELFQFWAFEAENGSISGGPDAKIPLNLWGLLSLCVIAYMMKGMSDWVVSVSGKISGGSISANVPVSGWDQTGTDKDGKPRGGLKPYLLNKRNAIIGKTFNTGRKTITGNIKRAGGALFGGSGAGFGGDNGKGSGRGRGFGGDNGKGSGRGRGFGGGRGRGLGIAAFLAAAATATFVGVKRSSAPTEDSTFTKADNNAEIGRTALDTSAKKNTPPSQPPGGSGSVSRSEPASTSLADAAKKKTDNTPPDDGGGGPSGPSGPITRNT